MTSSIHSRVGSAALLAFASLAACKGDSKPSFDTIPQNAPAAAVAAAPAPAGDSAPAAAPMAKKSDTKPAAKAAAATAATAAATNPPPPPAPMAAPAPAPAAAPAMAAAPPAAPAPGNHGPQPNALVIHSNAHILTAPATVPAGLTTVSLVNNGPKLQHIQIVKLVNGKTEAELEQAMKENSKLPQWILLAGGPNASMAGATSMATIDLSAGNYAIIGLKDFPEHAPYIEQGTIIPFTVTANSAPQATMPAPDVTVTVNEYAMKMSGPVSAGPRIIQANLTGKFPHEVVLFKLSPDKTEKDFKTWAADLGTRMPGIVVGGSGGIETGSTVQFPATLSPGTYVLASFVVNGNDRRSDIKRGMFTTFVVQ
jgi:hypothetical protein